MKTLLHDNFFRSLKNLGTFSCSYMEKSAHKVFVNYVNLNGIDANAYPELEEFSSICEQFILNLSQIDNQAEIVKFKTIPTTCSSEAILLAVYLLKKYWRKTALYTKNKPNIILSKHNHISWQKAAKFLDVNIKTLPICGKSLIADPNCLTTLLDRNTIAVCCTLGSPTTLCFDNVKQINKILQWFNKKHKIFIPIHVDAASGGFVAPFIDLQPKWGFSLEHVYSINISSHKYGLVYPSLGWLLTRKIICPKAYAFQQDYLGKIIQTYGVRFSHSAAHIATQYYQIKNKGFAGYKNIIGQLFNLSKMIRYYLSQIQEIMILSPLTSQQLPGVVFTLARQQIKLHAVINSLKHQGWILPTYQLPSIEATLTTRVVLRYGMTERTIHTFIAALKNAIQKNKNL